MKYVLIVAVICGVANSLVAADELQPLGDVKLTGVIEAKDISGVASFRGGEFLVVGADEGTEIQVLKRKTATEYAAHQTIGLVESSRAGEIDIEGVAADGDSIYVVGSHSRKRSRVKPDEKTQETNQERLEENALEPLREGLYRLQLDGEGKLDSAIQSTSLRRRIDDDATLKIFAQIPSKENGVDIEGIAVADSRVYVGFRGPVLRDGYVPILKFEFDKPHKADKLYVRLDSRGIRDLCKVDRGFFLIGGPMADAPIGYELYFWDGKDGVPGTDAPVSNMPRSLGRIPLPTPTAKAEGITVLKESDTNYEVLIVYDGLADDHAKLFRVKKPR